MEDTENFMGQKRRTLQIFSKIKILQNIPTQFNIEQNSRKFKTPYKILRTHSNKDRILGNHPKPQNHFRDF